MWLHLFFLIIALVLTWVWTSHPQLSFYSLQLIAALIILYFAKNIKKASKVKTGPIDALILTIVVLLLVFSTGGLNSPLFFLFYFLLFGISFLFEPPLAISFSLVLVIFLTFQLQTPSQILAIISLIFVSPLALFFGQQYLQNLAAKKRIKIFKDKWLENEAILEKGERDLLLWFSLNFRKALAEILEITALFLSDLSRLSPSQKTMIKKIRRQAKKLLKEGQKLKEKIDRQTDDQE